MRKVKAVLAAIGLLAGATTAPAAPVTFGVSGGAGIPLGDLGDAFNVGYVIGATADYWIKPNYSFGIDVVGDFLDSRRDLEQDLNEDLGTGAEASLTFLETGAHGRWTPQLESVASPWIQYGMGLYTIRSRVKAIGVEGKDSETDFGLNGAAGLDLRTRWGFKVGLSAAFHYVYLENDSAKYLNVALNLTPAFGAKPVAPPAEGK